MNTVLFMYAAFMDTQLHTLDQIDEKKHGKGRSRMRI